ncbi:substrate-binding domain-containing protein [Streptomyces inhibens]|uniref:substrate-binding domain-containing protein n=1 Tax=Streptomyces inhibens TaxID=2293571 RepID=UPI001FD0D31F|nr:substrate-binding domain-containing protein [Streptomyces inhibens]
MVGGPIAVGFHLHGVDRLLLDARTLAKIFNGRITRWNDPAIARLNKGVTLPSTPIRTFHRADSSGTTDNFTAYLGATAPGDWPYPHSKEWTAKGGRGHAHDPYGLDRHRRAVPGGRQCDRRLPRDRRRQDRRDRQ